MKYIMLINPGKLADVKIPVIFPDILNHNEVAESMLHNLEMKHSIISKVVSAGFIQWHNEGAICFGRSEELNLEAHEHDATIINTYDYTHGIQ